MNAKQKTTLLIMTLINTAMGLFPPWHIKYNGRLINQGYALLVFPPHKSAVITLSTLAVQVLIVIFVGIALIYYFKTPKQTPMELDLHVREAISALLKGDDETAIASFKAALGEEGAEGGVMKGYVMPEDLKLRLKALPPKQQQKALALVRAACVQKMSLRESKGGT